MGFFRRNGMVSASLYLLPILLGSCALVETSGTMTRRTGEAMEAYSRQNPGFIGDMAGFGGRISKAVGTSVENLARGDGSGGSNGTPAERFVEANETVTKSAYDAVYADPARNAATITSAQRRLNELGYKARTGRRHPRWQNPVRNRAISERPVAQRDRDPGR